jgi:hypothetical protein
MSERKSTEFASERSTLSKIDSSSERTSDSRTGALADSHTQNGTLTDDSLDRSGRHVRLSRHAYEKAQQRGFQPGHEWADWFAAEREMEESEGADHTSQSGSVE